MCVCVCVCNNRVLLSCLVIAAYSSYPCHVQVVNLRNIAVSVDLHFNLRYHYHFAININQSHRKHNVPRLQVTVGIFECDTFYSAE